MKRKKKSEIDGKFRAELNRLRNFDERIIVKNEHNRIFCLGCESLTHITWHHVLGNKEGKQIPLCKKCHDKVDNVAFVHGVNQAKRDFISVVIHNLEVMVLSTDAHRDIIIQDITTYTKYLRKRYLDDNATTESAQIGEKI